MIEIKELLDKFNNVLLSEERKKESVRKIISQAINIEISSKDLKIKNNIIYLKIKPIYKSEILLKQDKIFSKLEESFGNKTLQKII